MILIAGVLVVSSGAFSSVSAERSSDVSVVADSEAMVSLASTSNYSRFVDGELVIDFENASAGGVNADAITEISEVFAITNNGDKTVTLTISKTGDNSSSINFGNIEQGVQLMPGESYNVSVVIDSTGLYPGAEILESISISAVA